MSSSKEFKQAVKEGRLKDALAIAIGNTPELHITTRIASDNDRQHQNKECLRTHINLVEGEITNEIDRELISDRLYPNLQQFHLQQVTQGHQTVNQNIQSLQQIFRLLSILQKQQQGLPYTPTNAWKIDSNALLPATENANLNIDYSTMQGSPQIAGGEQITENTGFVLATESEDLLSEENEEDIVNELLSLDELDIEVEKPQKEPNADNKAQDDEDWGDWLEEDKRESDSDVMDVKDLEIEESEDWDDEG